MSNDVLDLGEVKLDNSDALKKIDEVGEKTHAAGRKSVAAWDLTSGAAATAAAKYNAVSHAIDDITGRLANFAESVTHLATEQGRLNAASEQSGLDFDRGAAAAGRFADETDALQASQEFAARDIRLTQGELDALARVAGATSAQLGITAGEGMERLTAAMIRGNERGLAPFGAGLVATAGHSHTMQERLHALVEQAGHVAPATDTAADAFERLKDSIDDAKRSVATAFADEFSRLMTLASPIDRASDSTERWNRNLTAAAQTAANIGARLVHGLGAVLGSVALVVSGTVSAFEAIGAAALALPGGPGAVRAAYDRSIREARTGRSADIRGFIDDRVNALESLSDETNDRTSAPAQDAADMTFTRAELDAAAANDRARNRRGGDGGGSSDNDTKRFRSFTAEQEARLTTEADRRFAQKRRDLAAPLRAQQAADEEAARVEGARRQTEAETLRVQRLDEERQTGNRHSFDVFNAGANDNDRASRERRGFEERHEALRTFTERWEELHHRQLDATREVAEGGTAALGDFGKAYGAHLKLVATGEETAADALQNTLADTLSAIGTRMGARAGEELAEGLAALASPITIATAPMHFAAAAAFTAGALATGAAGAALQTSTPPSGASAGEAPSRPLGVGSPTRESESGPTSVTINFGAGLVMGTPRELGEQLGRVLNDPTGRFSLGAARVRRAA